MNFAVLVAETALERGVGGRGLDIKFSGSIAETEAAPRVAVASEREGNEGESDGDGESELHVGLRKGRTCFIVL